ncbi:MAG: hypothetical protein ACOYI3_08515 [Christensenellales bacterium]|jgi:hypothetical protein
MKNTLALILVIVFLLAAGAGLYLTLERPVTVEFGGKVYTLESHAETFASKTFAFAAEDGSRVTGESDVESGGMVVTYTDPAGETSAVLTGKVVRKNGKYVEESFKPDESKNVGTAIREPEAHRFVLAVAQKQAKESFSTQVLLFWAMSAAMMVYGALTLGKPGKRAKWLPTMLILGGSLVIVALYADLLLK